MAQLFLRRERPSISGE